MEPPTADPDERNKTKAHPSFSEQLWKLQLCKKVWKLPQSQSVSATVGILRTEEDTFAKCIYHPPIQCKIFILVKQGMLSQDCEWDLHCLVIWPWSPNVFKGAQLTNKGCLGAFSGLCSSLMSSVSLRKHWVGYYTTRERAGNAKPNAAL